MKKWLFIIPVLFSINVLGQTYIPFPSNNTAWETDLMTMDFSSPGVTNHSYSFFETGGDTLINSKTYTIITKNPTIQPYCFLREENKTVLCKMSSDSGKDTTEFILYDFNVHLGDTVMLPLLGWNLDYYESVIIGEDSVLIGSCYHRRISIHSWIIFNFIEGVGSAQGLLYPEIEVMDWWANLLCFSMNDTIFETDGSGTFSSGNCSQLMGIEHNENDNLAKIFPNPASYNLAIEYADFDKSELYNSLGQLVLQSNVPEISLLDFPDGVYFIRIFDKINGKVVSQKVIISRMQN